MLRNQRFSGSSRNRRITVNRMTSRQKMAVRHSGCLALNLRTRKQREQLILTHLPLIRFIVHRIAMRLPKWFDSNDLVNSGVIGLLDAATKYDTSHNVQFKTYAELRIRGAILDSLRQLDWAPRSLRQKERLMEKTSEELTKQLGREVEAREMATAMGMSLGDYHKMRADVKGVSFGQFQPVISHEKDGGEPADVMEFVPAGEEANPHLICERSEMRRQLGNLINVLPRKERLVVTLYYYEELSMKEIGRILHVNESRVSQLRQKAMFLLRRRLKNTIPEIVPA